jgi:hypothetical protein
MSLDESEIGTQSCCHYKLSQIRRVGEYWSFPRYFLDDYYQDFFEDLEIDVNFDCTDACVRVEDIDWETLYKVRVEADSASVWYDPLKEFTFKSQLLPLPRTGCLEENLRIVLKDVDFPKFIKLDTVSAKDSGHNGVFDSIDEVIKVFESSQRIQSSLNTIKLTDPINYLFVRDIDYDLVNGLGWELRCFVYNQKLTAVSSDQFISIDQFKSQIHEFFKDLIPKIPYNDATIDIFVRNPTILDKPSIVLIEVNSFGADSPAGSGQYNWREDYHILHNLSGDTDFRVCGD